MKKTLSQYMATLEPKLFYSIESVCLSEKQIQKELFLMFSSMFFKPKIELSQKPSTLQLAQRSLKKITFLSATVYIKIMHDFLVKMMLVFSTRGIS